MTSGVATKWTDEMDALLGTMFDWKVAVKYEIHNTGVVRKRRWKLGIPAFQPRVEWTPEAIALAEDTSLTAVEVARRLGNVSRGPIGRYRREHGIQTKWAKKDMIWTPEAVTLAKDVTLPTYEVADQLEVGFGVIYRYRKKHGILRIGRKYSYSWTSEKEALLGTMPDSELADELVSERTVSKRRRELGIPAFGSTPIEWTPEMDALLGTMPDWKVGVKYGFSKGPASKRRCELGIPPYGQPIEWTPEMDDLLGTMSDRDVADEYGFSGFPVGKRRRKLGIPSWISQNPVPLGTRGQLMKELPNTLTSEQWWFACEWFDHCCAYCGGPHRFLEMDHLVPVAKGGPKTALNIVPACKTCNSSKRDKRAHIWIYRKFGKKEGQKIIDSIVAYLTEVQSQ